MRSGLSENRFALFGRGAPAAPAHEDRQAFFPTAILSTVIETHTDATVTLLRDIASFLAATVAGMALGGLLLAGAFALHRLLRRAHCKRVRQLWGLLGRLLSRGRK
ncbi:MAG: hypothetical protein AB7F74_04280 [Parvibaculaceae bacterium]